jgi:hypothetical protein
MKLSQYDLKDTRHVKKYQKKTQRTILDTGSIAAI